MNQRLPAWVLPSVFGLTARLVYLAFVAQREPTGGDDHFYWATAQSLAAGGGYSYEGTPTAQFMPGFPLLLAALIRVVGLELQPIRLVLGVISAAVIPLAFLLGLAWFERRVAIAAAWCFALYPPFWFFGTALLTETIAVLLVTALLLVASKGALPPILRGCSMGVIWGSLLYLKPELAALGLAYGFVSLRSSAVLPRRALVSMFALGLASLLPWVARNDSVFGEFIPLKASGGYLLFWASYHPPIVEVNLADPNQAQAHSELAVAGKPGATGRNYARAGLSRIVRDPGPYLLECLTVRLPRLFVGSQTEASPALGKSFSSLLAADQRLTLAAKGTLLVMQSAIAGLGLLGLCWPALSGSDLLTPRTHLLANALPYVALMSVPRYSMVMMPILIPFAVAFSIQVLRIGGRGPAPGRGAYRFGG